MVYSRKSLFTRRQLLKASAVTALAIATPLARHTGSVMAAEILNANTLARYVDPLPILPVQEAARYDNGIPYYEMAMVALNRKLHRDIPVTKVWGFNGSYPGPVLNVQRGQQVKVNWINNLPQQHIVPVPVLMHGTENLPQVRTVIHLHGANVPATSDGYPADFYTPGKSALFTYPNNQPATTLWYHDHAMNATRQNVYAGLSGFYLIRDAVEQQLNLPSGAYEIPLLIQDRLFNSDGSLFYPAEFTPDFFGNTNLVNGMVWPYLEVEPRKYRFRLLNAANERFYRLKLARSDKDGKLADAPQADLTFHLIGTDGGLLSAPVELEELLIAPAQRADLIIDFSKAQGSYFVLHNSAETPFINGMTSINALPEVMQFRVTRPLSGTDSSSLPASLTTITRHQESAAAQVRDLTMVDTMDEEGRMQMLLNGLHFMDPVTEKPVLGTTEIWRLINLTGQAHPIHLHLVQFQILDRRPFDVKKYQASKELVFTGPAVPVPPAEGGWNDTVIAKPAEVTRIIMRFGDYSGKYVWHCHILEHEDHDMMRPYEVVMPSVPNTGEGGGDQEQDRRRLD